MVRAGFQQFLHFLSTQMGILCLLVEGKKKTVGTTLIICALSFCKQKNSFEYANPNQSAVLCTSSLAKYDTTLSTQPFTNTNYAWTSLPYISSINAFYSINALAVHNNLLYVFGSETALLGSYTSGSCKAKYFWCLWA